MITHRHRHRVGRLGTASVIVCVASLAAWGCSGRIEDKWTRGRPATYPAGGMVLIDGEPVEGVKVQFEQPASGDGRVVVAFGLTDIRGRFRLRTFHDGDGAVAGEHAVLIERITFEPLPKAPGQEVASMREVSHLPERYRAPRTSGLSATVTPGGRNDFMFRIENSKP